jgi:regulator of RNase E activity RraA
VLDARGDRGSGVFGEILLTYFAGRGGMGLVLAGCLRNFNRARGLGLGLWLSGTTPNLQSQTDIFSHAANVPVACGNTIVVPGEIIVADDGASPAGSAHR